MYIQYILFIVGLCGRPAHLWCNVLTIPMTWSVHCSMQSLIRATWCYGLTKSAVRHSHGAVRSPIWQCSNYMMLCTHHTCNAVTTLLHALTELAML